MECHSKGYAMKAENQIFRKNYTGYVIMKAFPRLTEERGLTMLFCNKFNSSDCHPFYPDIKGAWVSGQWSGLLKKREWPPISTEMNQKVFETIGGIVYYIFGDSSGWLILFNIEGQTKYCFTAEWRPLSKDVRHERQSIFDYYS